MGILIDASILIEAERRRLDLAARIKGREEEECFISVITASELLHGVWRARHTAIRSRRSAFVEGILERFCLLPIDLTIARIHAQLWADLESKGISAGPHDSWLAASCIAHGYTLVTSDVEDFKRIPGLAVEQW
jgi:predicted nucleic acid-binding protein